MRYAPVGLSNFAGEIKKENREDSLIFSINEDDYFLGRHSLCRERNRIYIYCKFVIKQSIICDG